VAKVARDIPRGFAELVVVVDGKKHSRRVSISGFSRGRYTAFIDIIAPF
jgi:hypothetical protein